jgi:hypothetical protein
MFQESYMRWLLRSPWFYGFAGLLLGIVLAGAMVVLSGSGTSSPTPPSFPATTIVGAIPTTEPPWTEPQTTEPPSYTIHGTFTVDDFQAAADSIARRQGISETYERVRWTGAVVKAMDDLMAGKTFNCSAGLGGGYDDIHTGTQVTVTDEAGTLIGTSQLTGGKLSLSGCRFTYRIIDLPEARFYKIEVSHRGGLTHSFAEMTSQDWRVASKLG